MVVEPVDSIPVEEAWHLLLVDRDIDIPWVVMRAYRHLTLCCNDGVGTNAAGNGARHYANSIDREQISI